MILLLLLLFSSSFDILKRYRKGAFFEYRSAYFLQFYFLLLNFPLMVFEESGHLVIVVWDVTLAIFWRHKCVARDDTVIASNSSSWRKMNWTNRKSESLMHRYVSFFSFFFFFPLFPFLSFINEDLVFYMPLPVMVINILWVLFHYEKNLIWGFQASALLSCLLCVLNFHICFNFS